HAFKSFYLTISHLFAFFAKMSACERSNYIRIFIKFLYFYFFCSIWSIKKISFNYFHLSDHSISSKIMSFFSSYTSNGVMRPLTSNLSVAQPNSSKLRWMSVSPLYVVLNRYPSNFWNSAIFIRKTSVIFYKTQVLLYLFHRLYF